MTMIILLLASSLQFANAASSDDWLCTQESSQRRSNSILSCGIGIAKDEASARAKAFKEAENEFHRVCDISEDCKDHVFKVVPQRTACELVGSQQKCYRLLTFYIGSDFTAKKKALMAVESAKTQVSTGISKIKLKVGMKKSKVLQAFGKPASVLVLDSTHMSLNYYDSSICISSYGCFISFEGGRVEGFNDVDPAFIDL